MLNFKRLIIICLTVSFCCIVYINQKNKYYKPKYVYFDIGLNNGDSLLRFLEYKTTGRSISIFIEL